MSRTSFGTRWRAKIGFVPWASCGRSGSIRPQRSQQCASTRGCGSHGCTTRPGSKSNEATTRSFMQVGSVFTTRAQTHTHTYTRNSHTDIPQVARLLYREALLSTDFQYARTFLLWALLEQRAGRIPVARALFHLGSRIHPQDDSLHCACGSFRSETFPYLHQYPLFPVAGPEIASRAWLQAKRCMLSVCV